VIERRNGIVIIW